MTWQSLYNAMDRAEVGAHLIVSYETNEGPAGIVLERHGAGPDEWKFSYSCDGFTTGWMTGNVVDMEGIVDSYEMDWWVIM